MQRFPGTPVESMKPGINPAGMMTPEMLLALLSSKGKKSGISQGAIKRKRMGADIPTVSNPR